MKTKIILSSPILIFLVLFYCSKNPIWDQFAKNPYVKLGVNGSHAYVDITNEGARINTGVGGGYLHNGVTVERFFSNIGYYSSGKFKSYDENRSYEPGGSYKISVRNIRYNNLGGAVSFNATVDGFRYSYP